MKQQQWTIGMGITSQCNMKCSFCYSQDRRKNDDLSADAWISFIKSNASSICAINYGTGENTLSESWYQIITYTREKFPNIRQSLTTNGTLGKAIKTINKAMVIDRCIDEIDVSIDFANPTYHNKMRGFSGAFDLALDTLAYCKDYRKRATIVVIGLEQTLDIENLARLFELAAHYNAFIRINLYRHVHSKSTFVPPRLSVVLKALDWIIKQHTIVSVSEPVFRSIYGIPMDNTIENELFSMRILSNGDCTPSTYLITEEWIAGNILDNISLDSLLSTTPFKRFRNCVLPKECGGCHYSNTCHGGALDRRFLSWGNLDKPDIYCPRGLDEYFNPKKNLDLKFLNQTTVHSNYLPTMIFSPNT